MRPNPEDLPYVSNYPPLRDWLAKHNVICDWQLTLPPDAYDNPRAYVEQWRMPNGRVFVLVIAAHKHGWDIYTSLNTNTIAASLRDADERLGVSEPTDEG